MLNGVASREIYWDSAAEWWLPQANYILRSLGIHSKYEKYGIVSGIEYLVSFDPKVVPSPPKQAYLFLCPLEDMRSSEGRFVHPNMAAFWSLDPSGRTRLSHWNATMFGLPTLSFKMKVWARSWTEGMYSALREFHAGKGFDPDSQDIAKELGVPLYSSPWLCGREVETSGMLKLSRMSLLC
ncbi:hypothetical protein C8F01DRAFT_1067498 [Mycena amicta]|nr:hypothetical protein C8F01DRAFT_1067498 [Mycena amicta]